MWKPSPSTSPSRTTTAPTSGFGLTRPRPPSRELDRPGEVQLVGLQERGQGVKEDIALQPLSSAPRQPVDDDLGAGARVGERVEVERDVEGERHRPGASLVRARAVDDLAAPAQHVVVAQRVRDLLGLGVGAAGLRRAGHDPAVAAALVGPDQLRAGGALVVLELDGPPGALAERAVVVDLRARGRPLAPARRRCRSPPTGRRGRWPTGRGRPARRPPCCPRGCWRPSSRARRCACPRARARRRCARRPRGPARRARPRRARPRAPRPGAGATAARASRPASARSPAPPPRRPAGTAAGRPAAASGRRSAPGSP